MRKHTSLGLVFWAALVMALAVAPAALVAAPVQPVVGNWQGALSNGAVRVILHISQAPDGTLTGTLDSPDQGATGIAISSITYKDAVLHFELERPAASYDGRMSQDSSEIAGDWKQGGASLSLTFKRKATSPSVQEPGTGSGNASSGATIAFEPYENLVYVPVRVNGSRTLQFVIDTGAYYSVLNESTAREIGLQPGPGEQASVGSGEGGAKLWHAKDISFELGTSTIPSPDVVVLSLQDIERISGRTIDGVLGADLFRRYVVEIDYTARRIRLFDPQTYVYDGHGKAISLTISGVPLAQASVTLPGRKPVEGLFLIDTGSHSALGLNTPFVEKNSLLDGVKALSSSDVGIGGEWPKLIGRVQSLEFGDFAIDQPVTDFSQAKSGARSNAMFSGIIGGAILRRFTVIFDYSRHQMILEPNAGLKDSFVDDASGLILSGEGADFHTITVRRVLENSPAAETGLREGDVITAVAEKPGQGGSSLAEVREMLRRPGRVYTLSIARGGHGLHLRIKTRQLI
ncbi:MAG TPA: aspartyl protease family protein [Candidatus Angelobacter sp.]